MHVDRADSNLTAALAAGGTGDSSNLVISIYPQDNVPGVIGIQKQASRDNVSCERSLDVSCKHTLDVSSKHTSEVSWKHT